MLNANTVGRARIKTLEKRLQFLHTGFAMAGGSKQRRKFQKEIDLITAEIDRRNNS